MSKSAASVKGDMTKMAPKEDLKKILQCPACSKVPWMPIYQCKKGHIICARCRVKVKNCALCPFAPPFTETRNHFMENIVATSTFKCEMFAEGCEVNVAGKDLKKHMETCGYRPIPCFLGRKDGCNRSVVDFNKYIEHLLDVHNFSPVTADASGKFELTHSFTLPYKPASTRSWKSFFVLFDGKTFVPRICTIGTIDMLKFHIAIVGGSTEAEKYTAKITFEKQKPSPVPNYHFQLPVYPVRISDKDTAELHQGILNYGALRDLGQTTKTPGNEEQFEWSVQYQICKGKT